VNLKNGTAFFVPQMADESRPSATDNEGMVIFSTTQYLLQVATGGAWEDLAIMI